MRIDPDLFLGGFAPRLRFLQFNNIPFPGLPKLLLSATHLVTLRLHEIPNSGYISPEAVVTALSALTSLKEFELHFHSPRSCPDQASRRPPHSTRSVLPILTWFWFKGVTEYLEDLVARIDAPQLNSLHIIFFIDLAFDTLQLMQFITAVAHQCQDLLKKPGLSLRLAAPASTSHHRHLATGRSV